MRVAVIASSSEHRLALDDWKLCRRRCFCCRGAITAILLLADRASPAPLEPRRPARASAPCATIRWPAVEGLAAYRLAKQAKARDRAVCLINSNGDAVNASMVERARSDLVELAGSGRALACVRDSAVAMFDAVAPQLDGGRAALSTDLGVPEATSEWIFGTVAMSAGELVYAKRGLTIFLNPENPAVACIRLYVATTVDESARRLRPSREKRPHRVPPC